MATETITVTYRSKKIAKQNLTHMRRLHDGRFHTLVKNTGSLDKEQPGRLIFKPIGEESTKMIMELIRTVGGKVEFV